MNYRYRQAPASLSRPFPKYSVPVTLLMLLTGAFALGGASTVALAQSSRGPTVTAATKTAAALSPAQQQEVTAFVTGQVKELSNATVAIQQRSRDALARESAAVGAAASPAYQQAYAAALNAQLVPLAKSTNVRARLNGAIALARVARNAGPAAAALEPATLAFVADNSEAVALWAMKAAQFVLPAAAVSANVKDKAKLPAAIVAAAQKFGQAGDLTEDAYRALTLEGQKTVPPAAVPVVTPDLIKLFAWRVDQYAKRTPPRPDLEGRPVSFLMTRVWDSPTGKPLQPKIAQLLAKLTGFAAQHAVARESLATRTPFVEQLRRIGDAMGAVSTQPQLKEWAAPGKALQGISNSTLESEFTDRATAAFDAMKKVFAAIEPAPTIDEGAAVEAADEIVEDKPDAGAPTGSSAGNATRTGAAEPPPAPSDAPPAAGPTGARPAGGTTPPARTPPAQPR